MRPPLNLLIVSNRLESKRSLLKIIDGLPINTYTTCTTGHAWEVLTASCIDVIFCDETLPDGTYPDFLAAVRSEHKMIRFVVLLNSEEWEDYLQAMRRGAFEALRNSYQPTDLELLLIRVGHEVRQSEESHLSATA